MSASGASIETLAPGKIVDSVAYEINALGQVIGHFTTRESEDPQSSLLTHGFIATPVAALLERLVKAVIGVGPGKSLEGKILKASAAFAVHDIEGTCSALGAFVREVNKQEGKKIEPETAHVLKTLAGGVSGALSCS